MGSERLVREAESGNFREVKRLLAEGADPNATDSHGITALMAASLWSWPAVAECLVDNGANIEAKEPFFACSALMFACLSGTSRVVKLLLESGASVNALDRMGRTPLMAASSVGNIEAVKFLLRLDANVHAEDKFGVTAPDLSAIQGYTEVTALLLPPRTASQRLSTTVGDAGGRRAFGLTGH